MKKYVFEPYDEIFPALFLKEKTRILSEVVHILQIEHVGSTAVPGLGGKGIIDMAILTKQNDMASVSNSLQNLGYELKPFFNSPTHLYFVTQLPDQKKKNRRYHIHLLCPENPSWIELILLRDYLISHPTARQEYAALKESAIQNNLEGEGYRQIKDPFLKKILQNLRSL